MTAAAYAEVIGSPYDVWVSPVGTAEPALDALVATFDPAWFHLGTNGINNQGTGGVTVGTARTQTSFTPGGSTLEVKSWTTDEKLTVGGSVVDTTIEQVSKILDDATITTVAAGTGNPGHKSIPLVRGVNVKYFALLVRGISPYDDGSGTLNAQFVFRRVFQSASQQLKYVKGTPAEVAWEYTVSGTIGLSVPAIYDAQTAVHI